MDPEFNYCSGVVPKAVWVKWPALARLLQWELLRLLRLPNLTGCEGKSPGGKSMKHFNMRSTHSDRSKRGVALGHM